MVYNLPRKQCKGRTEMQGNLGNKTQTFAHLLLGYTKIQSPLYDGKGEHDRELVECNDKRAQ